MTDGKTIVFIPRRWSDEAGTRTAAAHLHWIFVEVESGESFQNAALHLHGDGTISRFWVAAEGGPGGLLLIEKEADFLTLGSRLFHVLHGFVAAKLRPAAIAGFIGCDVGNTYGDDYASGAEPTASALLGVLIAYALGGRGAEPGEAEASVLATAYLVERELTPPELPSRGVQVWLPREAVVPSQIGPCGRLPTVAREEFDSLAVAAGIKLLDGLQPSVGYDGDYLAWLRADPRRCDRARTARAWQLLLSEEFGWRLEFSTIMPAYGPCVTLFGSPGEWACRDVEPHLRGLVPGRVSVWTTPDYGVEHVSVTLQGDPSGDWSFAFCRILPAPDAHLAPNSDASAH